MREKDRRFLAEGRQAVAEAIDARRVEVLFHVEDDHLDLAERAGALGARVMRCTPDVMGHLTSTVTPQGVMAVATFLDVPLDAVRDPRLVAVLCAVRDPGNAGTIVRSADAAGADAIVFAGESVDVYNPKTVRASAGSLFHLPVVRGPSEREAVEALRRTGVQILAADAHGSTSMEDADVDRPTALLFGNEAWGLPPETAALADATVRIPMRGRAESLNLAAAATLLLFAFSGPRLGSVLDRRIALAAHDLRSPLTGLVGFASLLVGRWDRLSEDQRRELAEAIAAEGERMGVTLRRLIDAARAETGGLELSLEDVSLTQVADRAAAFVRRRAPHVAFEVEGEGSALADAERLFGTAAAMLEAMVHAGAERVTMRAESSPPAITVTAGSPSALDVPELDRTPPAIAIGLSLAAAVCRAHGGVLERAPGGFRARLAP